MLIHIGGMKSTNFHSHQKIPFSDGNESTHFINYLIIRWWSNW